ncbi:MAG: LuxR C-terminal-related transcriptional regulator [Wenzhouxiangellaceae bacterium]|nr:LuxR C-terminal-related transcriptional regulator [Wenzhouxiangellaceae bacterium]
MNSTHRQSRFNPRLLLALQFGLIAGLVGWDLLADHAAGADPWHVIFEMLILIIAAASMLVLIRRDWVRRRRMRALAAGLEHARVSSQQWRARYQETINGLAQAIQAQFHEWQLSEAEAEIGLLLLKGLGLKEIAAVRGTSERTVRDQARAVYRKAGVANRASLSAFFLEDLLLPTEKRSLGD